MGIIRIDNLEVFANHGVLKEENVLGQKFIISANLYFDISEAAKTDDINKSVNYAQVCEFIDEFSKSKCYKLIETLADGIALGILKKFHLLTAAEIEVKKPNPPIHMHFGYVSVTAKRNWSDAYISVGSNMGDRQNYIDCAVNAMAENDMNVVRNVSSIIETKPYGNVEQDNFLNGCIHIKTLYSPHELLDFLQNIELENGRKRTIHWGPRTLDLDILMYDDCVIFDENLILPHPDMVNREFVLEPLCEIAPYIVHPLEKKTILELLKQL